MQSSKLQSKVKNLEQEDLQTTNYKLQTKPSFEKMTSNARWSIIKTNSLRDFLRLNFGISVPKLSFWNSQGLASENQFSWQTAN